MAILPTMSTSWRLLPATATDMADFESCDGCSNFSSTISLSSKISPSWHEHDTHLLDPERFDEIMDFYQESSAKDASQRPWACFIQRENLRGSTDILSHLMQCICLLLWRTTHPSQTDAHQQKCLDILSHFWYQCLRYQHLAFSRAVHWMWSIRITQNCSARRRIIFTKS